MELSCNSLFHELLFCVGRRVSRVLSNTGGWRRKKRRTFLSQPFIWSVCLVESRRPYRTSVPWIRSRLPLLLVAVAREDRWPAIFHSQQQTEFTSLKAETRSVTCVIACSRHVRDTRVAWLTEAVLFVRPVWHKWSCLDAWLSGWPVPLTTHQ